MKINRGGWKLSEETKRRMSKAQKGKKLSEEHKRKMSLSKIGNKWNLGRKHSEEVKKRMSESQKRQKPPTAESKLKNRLAHLGKKWSKGMREKMKNYKPSEETKRKISISQGGSGISQVTSTRYYHLCDSKYKEWRSKVFQRDNWTCQTCGAKSKSGEPVYIEPHHIKGWAKYPELRYELSNGITLCKDCHILTRKKTICQKT